jgi:hypothetical protein
VSALIAQERRDNDKGDNSDSDNSDSDNNNSDNNNSDREYIDINNLIDPQLKEMSTTQLGIHRIEGAPDTHLPRTLPPRLYQTNPFARLQDDEELGANVHELTAKEVPATEKEIQDIAEEEEDDIAMSQAIETFVSRSGQERKSSSKVVDNAEQARQAKRAKSGGPGGRGDGRGGSGRRRRRSG